MKKKLITIIGPTAIGKTKLSIHIAKMLQTEIISADSRQIFRELSVGTAVPSAKELALVPHHFIQTISITDYYNVSIFENQVLSLLDSLFIKYDTVVLTGGSMMYVDAVCKGIDDLPSVDFEIREQVMHNFKINGIEWLRRQIKLLDPEYYKIVDLKNAKRLMKALEVCLQTGNTYTSFRTNPSKKRNFDIIKIGLNTSRNLLFENINNRVDQMINSGLVEEVDKLRTYKHLNSLNTVGYKEIFQFFDNLHTLEKAIELIKRNTRIYAKKQLTWFKKDTEVEWFDINQVSEIELYINFKIIES